MDKVNPETHKTFFPFILIGLSVLLAVGLYAMFSGPDRAVGADLGIGPLITSTVVAPTHDEYVASVASIITAFQTNQDAQRAYDQLIQITVPTADQGTHLELVIIFGKFLAGDSVTAQARYQTLKQNISWLP